MRFNLILIMLLVLIIVLVSLTSRKKRRGLFSFQTSERFEASVLRPELSGELASAHDGGDPRCSSAGHILTAPGAVRSAGGRCVLVSPSSPEEACELARKAGATGALVRTLVDGGPLLCDLGLPGPKETDRGAQVRELDARLTAAVAGAALAAAGKADCPAMLSKCEANLLSTTRDATLAIDGAERQKADVVRERGGRLCALPKEGSYRSACTGCSVRDVNAPDGDIHCDMVCSACSPPDGGPVASQLRLKWGASGCRAPRAVDLLAPATPGDLPRLVMDGGDRCVAV